MPASQLYTAMRTNIKAPVLFRKLYSSPDLYDVYIVSCGFPDCLSEMPSIPRSDDIEVPAIGLRPYLSLHLIRCCKKLPPTSRPSISQFVGPHLVTVFPSATLCWRKDDSVIKLKRICTHFILHSLSAVMDELSTILNKDAPVLKIKNVPATRRSTHFSWFGCFALLVTIIEIYFLIARPELSLFNTWNIFHRPAILRPGEYHDAVGIQLVASELNGDTQEPDDKGRVNNVRFVTSLSFSLRYRD